MKRLILALSLLLPGMTQNALALGIVKKWQADLTSLGLAMHGAGLAAFSGDYSVYLIVGQTWAWVDGGGNLLATFPNGSPGWPGQLYYVSSTNLVGVNPPGSGNSSTNTIVTIYSATNGIVISNQIVIPGGGPSPTLDPFHPPPVPTPILVQQGKLLVCYVLDGPELTPTLSLSSPLLTNGIVQTTANNRTTAPAVLEASPDLHDWTAIQPLPPGGAVRVTTAVSNAPGLLLRAVQR